MKIYQEMNEVCVIKYKNYFKKFLHDRFQQLYK